MLPPVPPSVRDGRMISGRPMSPRRRRACVHACGRCRCAARRGRCAETAMHGIGLAVVAQRHPPDEWPRRGAARRHRPAADHPPVANLGGNGGKTPSATREVRALQRLRTGGVADQRDPGRRSSPQERIRARGDARRQGRRHRLLDRELRPDASSTSITIAAPTLTDKEYQVMRDAAIAIIREIGTLRYRGPLEHRVARPSGQGRAVIEMNRALAQLGVAQQSHLGFPIAKIAAKLAAVETLDEIPNDDHPRDPRIVEPTIDYVAPPIRALHVREVRSRRRTPHHRDEVGGRGHGNRRRFKESLQKAMRFLEIDSYGFDDKGAGPCHGRFARRATAVRTPALGSIADAYREGMTTERISRCRRSIQWFWRHPAPSSTPRPRWPAPRRWRRR